MVGGQHIFDIGGLQQILTLSRGEGVGVYLMLGGMLGNVSHRNALREALRISKWRLAVF